MSERIRTGSGAESCMEEKHYWVALNMVQGVGRTLFHRLLERQGSIRKVFDSSLKKLLEVPGIGEKTAKEILSFDVENRVEREWNLAEKLDCRILTLDSEDYPRILRTIYEPPPVLYCQGMSLNENPATLAVVGTRAPSAYGKNAAEKLTRDLASRGATIVSGMARGIDTIAHKSALEEKSPTIAVLGCGLANTYPAENFGLRKRITENGTVVSEFPMTQKPDKANFPTRNRVISGLSIGTLVIEAGAKSGSLITAQFALDQGRDVFAVPGNILSPKSKGTHYLINNGAKLADSADSIIEEFPEYIKNVLKSIQVESTVALELTEREEQLMKHITFEEIHIDSLIESCALSPAEVSAVLIQLELKGLIRQLEGKRFVSNCQ